MNCSDIADTVIPSGSLREVGGCPPSSSRAAASCSPSASAAAASSTATRICWPTTSSARQGNRPYWTVSSSTTSCATWTPSTTPRSSRWTSNFSVAEDLGEFFLEQYSRCARDPAPDALKHFYIAYRAVVRAKVDCVRFAQGHAEASTDARRHIDIALEHLRAGTVQLIVVGGGPGTGKTTLSRGLAEQFGAQVISTDEVRRELQRAGVIAGAVGVLDCGAVHTRERCSRLRRGTSAGAHLAG